MPTEPYPGVHPLLVEKITRVLAAMAALGHPMRVTEGLRSLTRQKSLYSQGRSQPGAIVTNADGELKRSNHQAKADGYGHAVDCCFQDPQPYDPNHPWSTFGACCRTVGLRWGGDFTTIVDRPHAELQEDK